MVTLAHFFTSPGILLGYFGPWEIIILLLLIVLLFGRRLPEVMKSMGQGLKEFKKASNEEFGDNKDDSDKKEESDSNAKESTDDAQSGAAKK